MDPFADLTIPMVEGNIGIVNFLMAFLMFGVALDIKIQDFQTVIKAPRKVLIGLSSQVILLPILTLILLYFWQPHPSIGLGLLLIASVPGGPLSNFTVHLGHGNTALSVMMTAVVTILAFIITPLVFGSISGLWMMYDTGISEAVSVSIPLPKIVESIIILLLIPLTLGMFLSAKFPDFINKIKKAVRIFSLLIFLTFIAAALYANRTNIMEYMEYFFWIVIVHNVLALILGYQYSRWIWRMDKADCRSISIETGIQNGGLALILIFNFFPEIKGMAIVVAWWGVWDMISAIFLGIYWRKFPIKSNS